MRLSLRPGLGLRCLCASLLSTLLAATPAEAQRAVHGSRTVTAANTVVNEYTALTALASAGSTSITVANSALNSNGRFATNLQPGDLLLIIQIQGVVITNGFDVARNDVAWGEISTAGNYFSTGRYELAQVRVVPNATTITVDRPLQYTYFPNGGTPRAAQIVRVPRLSSLTINGGAVLTCDDWNGSIGGIVAVEVLGDVTVNAGGSINATGKGFRGGSLVGDNVTTFGSDVTYSTNNADGAEKGESVAGYQAGYDVWGGRYGRGAAANGGGGGDGHNAGGGGGANAGGPSPWNGFGSPDPNAAWVAAWNLEPPINTRSTNDSSGGGRGGYSFSGNNQNATLVGPSNGAAWGGDSRRYQAAGLGGRPLDYSGGRLFLGGGGGAGDQNNAGGGVGGDGGGLIYLTVYGPISGSGTLVANGNNGANAQGGTGVITGIDGGGGGGAGGTIVVRALGAIENTLGLSAVGGNGGNQVINLPLSTNEAEGPGGGGGGGYIALSNGTPTQSVGGGNNGTTNSGALTEFTANGATRGFPGLSGQAITSWSVSATDANTCEGGTATLSASFLGTQPAGTSLVWYDAEVAGNELFTGASYTTPALSNTTTYYMQPSPGWFRVPVTVTVTPGATGGPCTVGVGECERAGTIVCNGTGTGTVCNATPGSPVGELCDGLDNDCDGTPDNGFVLGGGCSVGQGECLRSGTIICSVDHLSTTCGASAGAPVAELCDGLDNDCDGSLDNGFPLGEACSVGVGACRRTGVMVCTGNHLGTSCDVAAGAPAEEICGDGLDNDCDGEADDGCADGSMPPVDAAAPVDAASPTDAASPADAAIPSEGWFGCQCDTTNGRSGRAPTGSALVGLLLAGLGLHVRRRARAKSASGS